MSEEFQYTGEKYEWTGDQKEFVTFILAAGRGYHDIDKLAEHYLKAIELDLSPYKDFREMRLAYEPDIDVDAYLAMVKEKYKDHPGDKAEATDAGVANDRYSPEEKREILKRANDMGVLVEEGEIWEIPHSFVKVPETDKNITWQGTLVEFMALVILCEKYGVMAQTKPVDARAAICCRLRGFVDVDFGHFTDFQSLYDAHHLDFDVRATRHKAYRIKKARHVFYNSLSPERKTKMTAFMMQASFNVETAYEFALRWPALNERKLYQIFDLLFIPEDLIAEQLGHRGYK